MLGRRGQGISLNVIIIAAIALVVLVILVALVFQTSNKVNVGTSCEGYGVGNYACVSPEQGCASGFQQDPTRACRSTPEGQQEICCFRAG